MESGFLSCLPFLACSFLSPSQKNGCRALWGDSKGDGLLAVSQQLHSAAMCWDIIYLLSADRETRFPDHSGQKLAWRGQMTPLLHPSTASVPGRGVILPLRS